MSIIHVDRLGYVEPANVVSVSSRGGYWTHYEEWRVAREYIWWGKPYRDRGGGLGDWYIKPFVAVRLVGKEHAVEIECQTRGEADRLRDSIIAQLNNGRDGAERIVAAAVRGPRMVVNGTTLETDRVMMTFTLPAPARHHNILHYLARPDFHVEQGFLTSTGRFVPRKEAMEIAVRAGQVSPSKVTSPDLFSEDLW